jgi:hypothetical protein
MRARLESTPRVHIFANVASGGHVIREDQLNRYVEVAEFKHQAYQLAGMRTLILLVSALVATAGAYGGVPITFKRDTFSFVNDTVFAYQDGRPSIRHEEVKRYTARCFAMARAVVQFNKFARFDPDLPPLDDAALADRIRAVTGRPPWREALERNERIVIPGVADLRTLSRTRTRVVQENIGLGWPTYFRLGNWRALLPRLPGQQGRTKARLDQMLAQGDLFVAYITTLPGDLTINHAIVVMARRDDDKGGNSSYTVYDPNFPDAPRILHWSSKDVNFWYPPNRTFVGGRVYVWQVYGHPLQ